MITLFIQKNNGDNICMKNNFEKITKFKFLFFVSLFLALMLINTNKVFAARSLTGGGFSAEKGM